MQKLRLVTVTGADDEVDVARLVELSARFPFVEWGLLVSQTRAGTQRYPSSRWLASFARVPQPINVALHICGVASRVFQSEGSLPDDISDFIDRRKDRLRVQINGFDFSRGITDQLRAWSERVPVEIILQAKRGELVGVPWSKLGGFSLLQDDSGGRGVNVDELIIPPPEFANRLGVAGGLTHHSVQGFLERFQSARREMPFAWIDMESGARDEHDEFEFGRVTLFLSLCSVFAT